MILATPVLAGWLIAAPTPVDDGAPALVVTTDTLAYCRSLAEMVASGTPSREATDLMAEGRSMCQDGEIRAGITRLRRALLIERQTARK